MHKKYFETNVKINPNSSLSLFIHFTIFCPLFKTETKEEVVKTGFFKNMLFSKVPDIKVHVKQLQRHSQDPRKHLRWRTLFQ